MLTNYQRMVLDDLNSPDSYGKPLLGWKGEKEFFRDREAPAHVSALSADLASTFVEQVYFFLTCRRPVRVYRGFEAEGLRAPYGMDHRSFVLGLVRSRRPGRPDGLWWTPARPSASIDKL